jgi:hypothetical protein
MVNILSTRKRPFQTRVDIALKQFANFNPSHSFRQSHQHSWRQMEARGSGSIPQDVGRATMTPLYRVFESATRYPRWQVP